LKGRDHVENYGVDVITLKWIVHKYEVNMSIELIQLIIRYKCGFFVKTIMNLQVP